MKPFKSGKEIATWMQRIALLPLLFQLYFNSVSALNFGNISFYLGICMLICGILIIIGGIFSKPGYTIICGLILFCVSIYKCIRSFNGTFDNYMAMHLIVIALGLFFFTNGNE